MGFNFRQLIGALYDNGTISMENEYPTEDNFAHLWLPSPHSMFVTVTLEDGFVYLLKEMLSLPLQGNITSLLILQQQANMILEDSHVGRVCMAATSDAEDGEVTLMYSHSFPASIDVDSAAELIAAAGKALTALKEAMEILESRICDGHLSSKDAFLVAVQEEVEVVIHPAIQLLRLTKPQRQLFLDFLSNKSLTLEAFLETKHLDIFPVVTNECEIILSNSCDGCWQIAKLPIAKDLFRRVELEEMLSGPYELYRAAAIFLGISQYKSLYDFVSEVSLSLY